MDSKGSIKDPTLRVIPSKSLREYLNKLQYTDDIPDGILAFVSNQVKVIKPREGIVLKADYALNAEDIVILKTIDIELKSNEREDRKQRNKPETERSSENVLKLTDLDWLYAHLENLRKSGEDVYFHELFEGSEILLPENEILERNPVLEARCMKLRNQQLSREYKAMTKSVDNVRARLPEDTVAYQMKQINKQLIGVAQFIMSVAAGFLFGFLGVDLMVGPLDFGFRLLLGVMCSLIIAIAEIYFLAKKLNEDFTVTEPQQIGGPMVPPSPNKKLHQE